MNKRPFVQTPGRGRSFNWRVLIWLFFLWFLLSLFFGRFGGPDRMPLSYTGFKKYVKQGRITEITVRGQAVRGKFKEPVKGEPRSTLFGETKPPKYEYFKTTMPAFADPELMGLLQESEASEVKKASNA